MQEPSAAHNRRAWDARAKLGQRFTQPVKDSELADPLAAVDSCGWLGGNIRGWKVLCLAAGGGRQSALYAAAGADVTVVDISPAMLEIDREVGMQRGFSLRTVQSSMDDLTMFEPAAFDLVIHPVSTCYLPEIQPVFNAVARVLRDGGLYISQHKSPPSLQGSREPEAEGYRLCWPYYRQGPLPEETGTLYREEGTMEFLHRYEEIVGGICRAGFVIEDLIEPLHADPDAPRGSFGHRSSFLPPYLRIKARRSAQLVPSDGAGPARGSWIET